MLLLKATGKLVAGKHASPSNWQTASMLRACQCLPQCKRAFSKVLSRPPRPEKYLAGISKEYPWNSYCSSLQTNSGFYYLYIPCAMNQSEGFLTFAILTLYAITGRIRPVLPKLQLYNRKGSSKKFPMSVATMSR